MQLTTVQLGSIVITLVLTILPGIYAGRKVKSADDYALGGRSAGIGMVAGSIIGTIVGGAATIGTAQLGFQLGLTAWWFTLGSGVGFIIMGLFYARPLHNSGLMTISEFLVVNFGKKAGPIASLSATAGIFFSIVASMLTSIHLIVGLFHVSLLTAATIIIVIVAALVFFGGINSSGMAGIFKILLVFATVFVGGILSYNDLGGLTGIRESFPAFPWRSLFGKGIEDSLFSLFSMVIGVISTQTYVQALFSAKDSATAAAGCVAAALIVIPVGLPSVMIGMYMHAMHPEINAIDALPFYLCTYLPEWLGGIGIAALLLSSLGSISGLALGIGTMISRDIFNDLFGLHDVKRLLWISRFSVLAVTFGAVIFVFHYLDSLVLHWNYLSMALRGAGIFLPLTFIVFFKGLVPQEAGLTAMIAGILVACLWPFIFPDSTNALFPSLAFNLFFLVPGVLWTLYKNKNRKI